MFPAIVVPILLGAGIGILADRLVIRPLAKKIGDVAGEVVMERVVNAALRETGQENSSGESSFQ